MLLKIIYLLIVITQYKVVLDCTIIYILMRIRATLHEDQYTFLIISRSVLLIMRNVSDKTCTENGNTHFMISDFFFSENRDVYGIMWKKKV